MIHKSPQEYALTKLNDSFSHNQSPIRISSGVPPHCFENMCRKFSYFTPYARVTFRQFIYGVGRFWGSTTVSTP